MTPRTRRGPLALFRSLGAPVALFVLALAGAALAAATPRTIVVRGHAYASDGVPVAGARVMARGTVTVNAMTDDQGRFTLSVPLGLPAGLRTAPFKLEVRAEAPGHHLPLSSGGNALVVETSWDAAASRVRVKSNVPEAATAVTTAIEVEGVNTAWIEADFGGKPKPGGVPAPASTAAPAAAKPVAVAAPVAARDSAPHTAARDTAPRTTPSDSARAAALKPPSVGASVPAAPTPSPAAPAIVATTRTVPADPPRQGRVRAIDPYQPKVTQVPSDSCACTLRGTVEIDWSRPLENSTPVRVELLAPEARSLDLVLGMGAPREFRFGPLPCGEWRLRVRANGKVRLADVTGDTLRVLRCSGSAETRVVLAPAKR